ncbi:hypothetical protein [Listeria kieliensis]
MKMENDLLALAGIYFGINYQIVDEQENNYWVTKMGKLLMQAKDDEDQCAIADLLADSAYPHVRETVFNFYRQLTNRGVSKEVSINIIENTKLINSRG